MGQQQLLLIVLGVVLVAIAIAIGIQLFGASHQDSVRDGMTQNLVSIAANAYQYKLRPTSLGGGSGKYDSYTIPSKLKQDDHGDYSVVSASGQLLELSAVASANSAWVIACTADDSGKTVIEYTGW